MTRPVPKGALSLDARMILRQLASQPAVVATIVLAALVGAFLVTIAPASLDRIATDDLRATVTDPSPARRNISMERRGQIAAGPNDDPMLFIRNVGAHFADTQFPESVQSIISASYPMVDTGRFEVAPLPGREPPHPFAMSLRFRFQEGADERLTVVEGTTPKPREWFPMLVGPDCPDDPDERAELIDALESGTAALEEGVECELTLLPHFQVLVTEATRQAMGLELGEPMLLTPDRIDPFYFGLAFSDLEFSLVMSISGVIELDDGSDDYWFDDQSLHTPRIRENADLRQIFATGLAAETDLAAMNATVGHAGGLYTWRYFVSPDRIVETDIDRLEADLESLQAEYASVGRRFNTPLLRTQLPDLLEDHKNQQQQTLALLSTALAGLVALVVAVILLLTLLMTERQRGSLVSMRGRGASGAQLALTRTYEGLMLIVPACASGYLLARWLIPETDPLPGYRATVALASMGVLTVVVGTVPLLKHRLGDLLGKRSRRPAKPAPYRMVVELTVSVLAIGAVLLLRRRAQGDPVSSPETDIDLLLAATPVLVPLAVGLLTLRLLPSLIRLIALLASRSRGVVPLVGLRRILQQRTAERLPILVIVLCMATAAFSILGQSTISNGQRAASWEAVGGDYSITNFTPHSPLPAALDLDELEGATEIALGATFDDARIISDVTNARPTVLAIDANAYERVTEGTVGHPGYPTGFDDAAPGTIGTEVSPIPAIVSAFWPGGLELQVGQLVVLDTGRSQSTLVISEIRDQYPDMEGQIPFVVVDLDLLQRASDLPIQPTVAYLRAPASVEASLGEVLAEQSSAANLTSRHERLRSLTEDPFVSWVQTTLKLLFALSVGLAAVTAVSALALGSAARVRDFAFLQTMGVVRRQTLAMTVIEQVPSVAIATVAGIVAGVSSGLLLGPAIDFAPFTGGARPAAIQVDWLAILSGALVLLVGVGISVGIFLMVLRANELTHTLRVGEEP